MGIIYLLENKINGKIYVGQTIDFVKRMKTHKYSDLCIDEAIRKHRIENFKITLMECSEKYLDWMEQEWIKEMNSLTPNGYNIDTGGHEGKHRSEETKKKISEAKKGNKNPMFRKVFSEETRRKMSMSRRGVILSEETKQRMSKARIGTHPSQKTREKMRENNIGKTLSIETRQRISEALKAYRKRIA